MAGSHVSSPRDRFPSADRAVLPTRSSSPQTPSEDLKGDGTEHEDTSEEKAKERRTVDKEVRQKAEGSAPPPLPDEELPSLPNEVPPGQTEDDGWEPIWDGNVQAYYFYNRFTSLSQWENPRVPNAPSGPPGVANPDASNRLPSSSPPPPSSSRRLTDGYNPAIHGDYDPTAPYAQQYEQIPQIPQNPQNPQKNPDAAPGLTPGPDPNYVYTATGVFNRFTGKWQSASLAPENFSDENKAQRQLSAFFDVDTAANSHDGRSLKAERSGKKLTKKELKAFKEKRRERKEEKRRAWLRD